MLNHALSKKDDRTKLTLIFANVSPADILLREEFEKLQKDHPDRFNAVFVVDKPTDGWTGKALFMLHATVEIASCARGKGYTGYISSQIIKDHVKAPSENVKIYVCGRLCAKLALLLVDLSTRYCNHRSS